MVVKIMEPASTSAYSLDYNDSKCAKGEATLIDSVNVDESLGLARTLERYERGSIRTTNLGFHMSVNPGPGEYLDQSEALAFIHDMMKYLGYGSQPYAVYRHSDINREHYHVVSVRVKADGYKIPDFQENRRCMEILSRLAPAYGLSVGNGVGHKYAALGIDPKRFSISSGNVIEQMRIIAQECTKYHFTSFAQFKFIMSTHGLDVQERGKAPLEVAIRGLNQDGIPCTAPMTEKELGINLSSDIVRRISECDGTSSIKKRERARISAISATCIKYSKSEKHFKNMLARHDIDMLLHRTKEGRIYGASFVDHSTRCAFKCSELGAFKLESIIAADENGQWKNHQSHEAHEPEQDMNLVGTALAAVGKSNSKSQEKDMKDKPKKRRLRR